MALDVSTGEIAGRVPYQPAVTKEYKFTVEARRFTSQATLLAAKQKTFTVNYMYCIFLSFTTFSKYYLKPQC